MNKSIKLANIDGEPGLKKDMNSKAILNTDEAALEEYKRRMKEKKLKTC